MQLLKKCIVRITARFAPANDCVLFVFLKLVFVALPSGTISWVDLPGTTVVSGVANCFFPDLAMIRSLIV